MGIRANAVGLIPAVLIATGCAFEGAAALEQAVDECGTDELYIYTADEGHTLIIDHEGEEDIGGATIDELVCILLTLETPTSVTTQMDSTRALDGRQSATWDTYSAT